MTLEELREFGYLFMTLDDLADAEKMKQLKDDLDPGGHSGGPLPENVQEIFFPPSEFLN